MASCKGIGPELTVPETNPMASCKGFGLDLTVPETNPAHVSSLVVVSARPLVGWALPTTELI